MPCCQKSENNKYFKLKLLFYTSYALPYFYLTSTSQFSFRQRPVQFQTAAEEHLSKCLPKVLKTHKHASFITGDTVKIKKNAK